MKPPALRRFAALLGLWLVVSGVSCGGGPAGSGRVPAPVVADTGRILVGAIHCPLWNDGKRWQSVARFPDREPLLGWYDEGDPEVTDWEIKWALEHGISFFLTCWYREAGNEGQAVKPALDHWLAEGLPQSRFGGRIRFALMFENGHRRFAGGITRQDLLENLLPFWIAEYLDNWNEFGEGHYLMPTRGFGFGHLDAVRQVFAPASPVPDRILPQDLGLGPYDSHFRAVSGTQTP